MIYVYTLHTPLYGRMNMDLRAENKLTEFKSYLNALTGALYSQMVDPRIMARDGTVVYRSAKLTDDQINCFREAQRQDREIVWKSFTSTSKSRSLCEAWNVKFDHNVIFEIRVYSEHARDISAFSRFANEEEVLLKRGSLFTLGRDGVKKSDHNDKWVIHLKQKISVELMSGSVRFSAVGVSLGVCGGAVVVGAGAIQSI